MKNLCFLFILAAIISLAACTTEDGPIPGENFQLALSTDVQFQSINDTIPFEIELTDDVDPSTSFLRLEYQFTSGSGKLYRNSMPINKSTVYREPYEFAIIANELGKTTLEITIWNEQGYEVTSDITFHIGPNRPPVVNILSHEFFVEEKLPDTDEVYNTSVEVTLEAIDLDGTIANISLSIDFDADLGTTTKIAENQYKILSWVGEYNHTKNTYSISKPGDTITITVTDNDGDSSVETFILGELDKSNIE